MNQQDYDKGYLDGYYIGIQGMQDSVDAEVEYKVKEQCREYALKIDKLNSIIRELEYGQTEFYKSNTGRSIFECRECRAWNKLPSCFRIESADDPADEPDEWDDADERWDDSED